MKQPAVFIDRDGTINEQLGYINHESRFIIFPFVAEAVKLLNDKGFLAIVVTNQSGIGRGYYPEDLVLELHERLEDKLGETGARLDRIYYCPHHPHAELEAFINIIRTIRDQFDMTILWVEHVMKAVVSLAERLVVLNFGNILTEGLPKDVMRNPAVIEAYLGEEIKYA